MAEPNVVVIGDALIDEIRDETGTRDVVGGAALNVAVGLAVLGVRASLIAMVGDDDDGAKIRDYLERYGVELLATRGPLGTSRAVSIRIGGEPNYVFNEAAKQRRVAMGPAERAALDSASHVVISCFPFDDVTQRAEVLAAIDSPRTRLIIDPNPRAGMMLDLAEFGRGVADFADCGRLIKIGDDDAALLYHESAETAAYRFLDGGVSAVLATAGASGAVLYRRGLAPVTAPIASVPGDVVDTMGAGDATVAAMTRSVALADTSGEVIDWPGALSAAMRVAAATCRAHGALLRLAPSR